MSCFVEQLRGSDAFIMDAAGLQHNVGKGRDGNLAHMVIPLVGRSKGETGIRHNLQSVFIDTLSKLKVR